MSYLRAYCHVVGFPIHYLFKLLIKKENVSKRISCVCMLLHCAPPPSCSHPTRLMLHKVTFCNLGPASLVLFYRESLAASSS